MPKPQVVENKEVASTINALPQPVVQQPDVIKIEEKPELLPSFQYASEKVDVTFIESKAAIKDVIFKAHQAYKLDLKYGFIFSDKDLVFKNTSKSSNMVVFEARDQNKKVIKRFDFSKTDYTIDLDIEIQNMSNLTIPINLSLYLAELDLSSKNVQSRYYDVTVSTNEKTSHYGANKDLNLPAVKYIGFRDRYFCVIAEPKESNYSGFIRKANSHLSDIGLSSQEISLPPGQRLVQKFRIYLGPQDLKLLNSINPSWGYLINYGTFDFIAQMILQTLEFLYKLVHNWGLAIIILSVLVYFILYPLTLKQMRSMKEMQLLQPKIEELRKAYKDNPQKLNKEIMELYKTHKVNPLGGCLPLILQMPIFFALYQVLMRYVFLKGARFLWITDLSEPDKLFTMPWSIPVLGNEFNILPIIMAIGMFVQQKMSMAGSATGSAAEQQKMMLVIMPIMFGVIFYHMPSGLVLYWFVNSALMLVYQLRMRTAK